MLTHLWPTLDPVASVEEGSEAFGHAVTLAAPHLVTHRVAPPRSPVPTVIVEEPQ